MSVFLFIISVLLLIASLLIANAINEKKCNKETPFKLIWCMFNCIALGLCVLYSVHILHFALMFGWAFYIAYELNKVKGACNLNLCKLFNSEPCKARQ